ncbi:uncharacterized protein BCR38DRAFT_415709 [Pseudomassariella vexata]|uniref:Uncharacterized protein n=1 Tax=Pseudomassariella vexata TaxID=1141098 RepID=A0A1Y2EIG0_9PEZI|nr:uncharacterized protein BCR38DRAFT_415709 [Pseudomassariella vexata]ORY71016.1 hypothetical protein BCR38DRAFT_415709 [Pseudomassariella vexata]
MSTYIRMDIAAHFPPLFHFFVALLISWVLHLAKTLSSCCHLCCQSMTPTIPRRKLQHRQAPRWRLATF